MTCNASGAREPPRSIVRLRRSQDCATGIPYLLGCMHNDAEFLNANQIQCTKEAMEGPRGAWGETMLPQLTASNACSCTCSGKGCNVLVDEQVTDRGFRHIQAFIGLYVSARSPRNMGGHRWPVTLFACVSEEHRAVLTMSANRKATALIGVGLLGLELKALTCWLTSRFGTLHADKKESTESGSTQGRLLYSGTRTAGVAHKDRLYYSVGVAFATLAATLQGSQGKMVPPLQSSHLIHNDFLGPQTRSQLPRLLIRWKFAWLSCSCR